MVEHWFVVPGTRVRFPLLAQKNIPALVVKWISRLASDQAFQVRVLTRAQSMNKKRHLPFFIFHIIPLPIKVE